MSFDYMDNLNSDSKNRYKVKLETIGLEKCPYKYPADTWIDDPKAWPNIEYADIYCYLVESNGPFSHAAMKNYRSLEAHQQFRSGWVQNVYHQVTSKGFFIFKAAVRPSQRMNDGMHNPWVAADMSGCIVAAHCTCMAGLGESCTHVAAVLFKVEAAVRLGYTTVACTDVACQWNKKFVTDVQPAQIKNINFYRDEAKESINKDNKKKRTWSQCSPKGVNTFLSSLMDCNVKSVGLSLFEGQPCMLFKKRFTSGPVSALPPPLRTHYKEGATSDQLDAKCTVLKNLTLTDDQIIALEKATVQQADSTVWHDQRAGRITASRVHDVLHTNQENPARSVLLGITRPSSNIINAPALLYGRANEPEVLKTYGQLSLHNNLNISHSGLRLDHEYQWLGASADGLAECDCHGKGVIEIKCPYSARNMTRQQYLESKYCCLDEKLHLKPGHHYFDQVQIQMRVYNVKYCTFIVKVGNELIINNIMPDDPYVQASLKVMKTFWNTHIVHELVTRAVELQSDSVNCDRVDRDTVYCYCQEPYDPSDNNPDSVMVGCDGANCKYEWIHLRCIIPKRKTVPKGNWYCKDCKKN